MITDGYSIGKAAGVKPTRTSAVVDSVKIFPFGATHGWKVLQSSTFTSMADILGDERVASIQWHIARNVNREIDSHSIEIMHVAEVPASPGFPMFLSVAWYRTPHTDVVQMIAFITRHSILVRGAGLHVYHVAYPDVDSTFADVASHLIQKARSNLEDVMNDLDSIWTGPYPVTPITQ